MGNGFRREFHSKIGEDGWSRLRDEKMRTRVPLMFSLKATKKENVLAT